MATGFGHTTIIWPYQYKLCFSPVHNVCANIQSRVISTKTTCNCVSEWDPILKLNITINNVRKSFKTMHLT